MVGVESFRIELERARAMAEEAVVIDLRLLQFIDSSGLRAVLDGHELLVERGLTVTLLKPPERLWRVFTVTGADKLLPFDDEHLATVDASPGAREP
jgi:anti-anti-sigma factor